MPSLLGFFAITYALAWVCFLGYGALTGDGSGATLALGQLVLYVGVFAPGLVAIGLTARAGGRAAVGALLGRILEWRAGARWYVFALGYMASVKLIVALVHRVATGEWPTFGATPWFVMAAAIAVSTWVQAGEEVGWRGYALPRLAQRMGMARASLLLGVIWALWHLPLFYIANTTTTGQSLPFYLLQVMALSVAIAWLYQRANGSLLLPMIMHAAVNNTKDIVPSWVEGASNPLALQASLTGWLTLAVLWLGAAYFLVRMTRAERAERGVAPAQ